MHSWLWYFKLGVFLSLCLIPASVAARKGRSYALWYVLAVFLPIIIFPAAFIIKPLRPTPDDPHQSPAAPNS